MGGPARPLMVQNNLGLEHVRCGAVTFGVLNLSFEAQWDFTGGTSTAAFHPQVSPHFEHLPFVQTTYKCNRLVAWLNWG